MALASIIRINADFYDNEYILINAKQHDKGARYVYVTCYNHGEIFPINSGEHSAYVRYKKADNYSVFRNCEITHKGEVAVELTEQMLAVEGICYADLIIVDRGRANIDIDTGEITTINNGSILSTMVFCINVLATSVENSEIESTYSFDGFNYALERAEAEYKEVIMLAKSYAVGDAGGVRKNENTDNSKYYYEQSVRSINNAKQSENGAENYFNLAKSYAVGDTGVRNNENYDNSHYYYQQIKNIINGFENGFMPMGTISFSELANVDKMAGYVYNIRDDFVTDARFAEGTGKSYTAGTNVYYTAQGLWDCFGGSASVTATVNEVKSYLGI